MFWLRLSDTLELRPVKISGSLRPEWYQRTDRTVSVRGSWLGSWWPVKCTRILRTSLKYRLRCCSMDERVEQIIVRKQGHKTSVVERCLSRDEVECRWSLGFRGRLKADRDGGRVLIGFAAEKQWDDERRLFIKVVFGSKPNKCQMERQKD